MMNKLLLIVIILLLAAASFFFGVYFNQWQGKSTLKPTSIVTPTVQLPTLTPTPTNIPENTYTDAYFDITFTYAKDWTVATKQSENRECDLAKEFLRSGTCQSGPMATETLMIRPLDALLAKKYGVTIEAATSGIGFACDEEMKDYPVAIKGKTYQIAVCPDSKTQEERSLAQLEVTGEKSIWKAILLTFSVKDEATRKEILKLLESIK